MRVRVRVSARVRLRVSARVKVSRRVMVVGPKYNPSHQARAKLLDHPLWIHKTTNIATPAYSLLFLN